MFRFIVDKDLNKFQGKDFDNLENIGSMLRWKTDINYSELIFYQLILWYMYLLNYLMRLVFDNEKVNKIKDHMKVSL